ncbi:MAG: hypothetical protein ACKO3T_00595 [Planctomycetaceae bacterium]
MLRIDAKITHTSGKRGRRRSDRPAPAPAPPRISRLMALAIRYADALDQGELQGLNELAERTHVSQPRVTQVLNLVWLAPDIQEALLFLPPTLEGRELIHEKRLRPLTKELCWKRQRELWQQMLDTTTSGGR